MMRRRGLNVFLAAAVGICALSVVWAQLRPRATPPMPHLTVEILNGSGVDRLGARWAERLRGLGQDVLRVGDADRGDHSRTLLIDRRGRQRLSARLARELGGVPLLLEALEGSDVELTLILGADHGRYALPEP